MKVRATLPRLWPALIATLLPPPAWARLEIPPECRKPGASLVPTRAVQAEIPWGSVVSDDGKVALGNDPEEGEIVVVDLETGSRRKAEWKNGPKQHRGTKDYPQPDGRSVVRIDPRGDAWIFDTKTGASTRFGPVLKPDVEGEQPEVAAVSRVVLSRDKKHLVLESGMELVAVEPSGRTTRHPLPNGSNGYGTPTATLEFLPEGSVRYSAHQLGDLRVVDWNPSNGNITPRFDASKIQWKKLGGKLEASPPTLGLVLGYPGGYPGAPATPTGTAPETFRQLRYSTATGEVIISTSNGRRLLQDVEDSSRSRVKPTQELRSLGQLSSVWTPEPDEHGNLLMPAQGTMQVFHISSVACIDPTLTIQPANADCADCRSGTGLQQAQATKLARELVEKQLCGAPFDARAWDRATGEISASTEARPLARDRAELLWLRFQKLGGFDPDRHGTVLLSLLRSDIARGDPAGTRAVLQNVSSASDVLYGEIVARMPELLRLSLTDPSSRPRCQTDAERKVLLAKATKALELMENPYRESPEVARWWNPSRYSDWERLAPFSNLLATLPEKEREEHIDLIGQSLADSAATSSEFRDVFLSKLYKFASRSVAPLFGEKPGPVTDLTYTREGSRVTPIVLGTEPVEMDGKASPRSAYGFYAKTLEPVTAPASLEAAERSIRWRHSGRSFSADLGVRALEKANYVPDGPAPNYEDLWRDGRLSGMVVVGSNLKGSSASLMQEYLAYYQSHGFHFEEKHGEVREFSKHLEEKTASGELDYLIKEAHSDGDEKNLFRMDSKVKILRGERTIAGTTRREAIELVYPASDAGDAESKLISNQEFGEWVRRREKDGKGQFVYFNTSCWSHTKALHEIESARSTKLLNIATQTTAHTFGHENLDNGLYHVLEGFRKQESYAQLRKRLGTVSGYQDDKNDVYLFPDEARYRELITDKIATPLDIRLEVRDEKGRPYSIDEQH